jgi:WD40 repeat protein
MLSSRFPNDLDIAWSLTNELLLSVSLDGTMKIWDTSDGDCIRTIDGQVPLNCCIFHPLNANAFLVSFPSCFDFDSIASYLFCLYQF